jgi:hypothetical protein
MSTWSNDLAEDVALRRELQNQHAAWQPMSPPPQAVEWITVSLAAFEERAQQGMLTINALASRVLECQDSQIAVLAFGIQRMGAAPEFGHRSATWEIAEVARTPEGRTLLNRYLNEITEGPAFRGSHRSAQFLEYIIWQSAAGKIGDLKERTIGVEVFGRTPTYDTGEDAIVRVTASDVRKRLVQHYSAVGKASEFRINLPAGGYVPELIRLSKAAGNVVTHQPPLEENLVEILGPGPSSGAAREDGATSGWKYWTLPVLGIIAMTVGIALSIMNRPGQTFSAVKRVWSSGSAPWATLFDGSRRVLIVASDPNIEEIQRISHSSLSLSDYANQSYLPPGASDLSPSEISFMKEILRGNKISAFDGSIIANLASLMTPGHSRLLVKAARDFRVKDLQTDEDFVFLGSPRSNPWTSMFNSVLDFQFAFDNQSQREFVRNVRPAKGEKTDYIPTAGGFGTGDSFAIISVFHNPGYAGRVLIIAGASGEGTKAAGDLVADPARWTAILRSCHAGRGPAPQSLQILLYLETMAGSPSNVNPVACHVLPSGS